MANSIISVSLIGNIMIGRNFNTIFQEQPFHYPWGNVSKYLLSSDLVVGNLENTITASRINSYTSEYSNKGFRLHPDYIKTLNYINLDYVSLSNNHILDYGEVGLRDTRKYLATQGILSGGAGGNIYQARKATFTKIKGKTFAFLSMSEHFPNWKAYQNTTGIWQSPISELSEMIKREIIETLFWTKQKSDYIFFSIHWGNKKMDLYKPHHQEFARFLIDNGVNVVYGHNPGHILPFEYYKKGIIFYSLGNFINDYQGDTYNNQIGIIVTLVFQNSKVILKKELIHPIKISKYVVNFITDRKNHDQIMDYFYDIYKQKRDILDSNLQIVI